MNKNEILNYYTDYSDDSSFVRGARTILNALDNIKHEPKLLEFLISEYKKNNIELLPSFYVIEYEENYQKVYNWVFTNEDLALDCARSGFNSEKNEKVPSWILFERYRIRKLN